MVQAARSSLMRTAPGSGTTSRPRERDQARANSAPNKRITEQTYSQIMITARDPAAPKLVATELCARYTLIPYLVAVSSAPVRTALAATSLVAIVASKRTLKIAPTRTVTINQASTVSQTVPNSPENGNLAAGPAAMAR